MECSDTTENGNGVTRSGRKVNLHEVLGRTKFAHCGRRRLRRATLFSVLFIEVPRGSTEGAVAERP